MNELLVCPCPRSLLSHAALNKKSLQSRGPSLICPTARGAAKLASASMRQILSGRRRATLFSLFTSLVWSHRQNIILTGVSCERSASKPDKRKCERGSGLSREPDWFIDGLFAGEFLQDRMPLGQHYEAGKRSESRQQRRHGAGLKKTGQIKKNVAFRFFLALISISVVSWKQQNA